MTPWDLNITGAAEAIASSSSGYMVVFMPVFVLVIGITLAFSITYMLVGLVKGENPILDETRGDDDN